MSEWVEEWARKGWRRGAKPIPNADLWQRLLSLNRERQVDWRWLRGHVGHPLNEQVHRLATAARDGRPPAQAADESAAEEIPPAVLSLRALTLGSPGPGGWGAVLDSVDGQRSQSGGLESATVNRLELIGAIEALSQLPAGQPVLVLATSEYLVQGATRWVHRWRKNGWLTASGAPVTHSDLWQKLDRLQNEREVTWRLSQDEGAESLALARKLAADAAAQARR
jgi:ribonuclease HI